MSSSTPSLLCLDIGTATLKACVFQEKNGSLELLGYAASPQHQGNLQAGAIVNLAQTIADVQEVVRKAENMAKISPKDLIIGISGELMKGITVTLSFERPKVDKVIDDQELKTIIYELQWQAFDITRRAVAEDMSLPEIELKLLNASVVGISVDRETVEDPRGLIGRLVTLEIFHCFAPIQHFGQIQNIAVELPYHHLKGVFVPSFAIAHCLTRQRVGRSGMVVDIGAGTTDITVFTAGNILGSRSFSLGGQGLTKRIALELGTSFDEAESIKLNYSGEDLEKKSTRVIHESIQSDIDIWISSLLFSLKELPLKMLPLQISLVGKASLLPEFSQALLHFPWDSHFPTEEVVEVKSLEFRDILQGEMDMEFDDLYLPLVAVANTAYDLLYQNSVVEEILNSVIADKAL